MRAACGCGGHRGHRGSAGPAGAGEGAGRQGRRGDPDEEGNRAMTKLSVRDRAQLVVPAYESGLVTPGGD